MTFSLLLLTLPLSLETRQVLLHCTACSSSFSTSKVICPTLWKESGLVARGGAPLGGIVWLCQWTVQGLQGLRGFLVVIAKYARERSSLSHFFDTAPNNCLVCLCWRCASHKIIVVLIVAIECYSSCASVLSNLVCLKFPPQPSQINSSTPLSTPSVHLYQMCSFALILITAISHLIS